MDDIDRDLEYLADLAHYWADLSTTCHSWISIAKKESEEPDADLKLFWNQLGNTLWEQVPKTQDILHQAITKANLLQYPEDTESETNILSNDETFINEFYTHLTELTLHVAMLLSLGKTIDYLQDLESQKNRYAVFKDGESFLKQAYTINPFTIVKTELDYRKNSQRLQNKLNPATYDV
jgi:hypothetical protein